MRYERLLDEARGWRYGPFLVRRLADALEESEREVVRLTEERDSIWNDWVDERGRLMDEVERLREGIEECARRLDSEADSLDIKRVPLTVPAALWGIVDDLRALAASREAQR